MSELSDMTNAARTDVLPGITLAAPTFEDEASAESEFVTWFMRTNRASAAGTDELSAAEDLAQRKLLGGELDFGGVYFTRWAHKLSNAPLLAFILARHHYAATKPADQKALFDKLRGVFEEAKARGKGEEWEYQRAVLRLYGYDFAKKNESSDAGAVTISTPSGQAGKASSANSAFPPPPATDSIPTTSAA